ncbi:unnamed protein product [Oppiella nova]|uniref:Uncharacterized protein n=1 Tax=Oppiella nova TaxID=334625 RepID=A0A7R9QF45_9ACAR|nr:unnamed protein product [Oppiella nova]CAG2164663.1 unnamed protein product [Oppiella nova]
MPDNETNDNTNKRPKRRAAQRTYLSYENTSVWSEDKDLKRALLASLQDAKKSSSKTHSVYEQNQKKQSITGKANRSDTKLSAHNGSQAVISNASQPLVADNSLLSSAAYRRKVSAQRKFAQSCGFGVNSPVSTPIKTGFVASNKVVELFPNQKPNTEDFLTFLCLRQSSILPPNLDFIRVNSNKTAIDDKRRESDSQNISDDESEANDKYSNCRIRSSDDRRGSSSSNVSKTTSLSSRTSLQTLNRKLSEHNLVDKSERIRRTQSMSCKTDAKKVGSDLEPNLKPSQLKKISKSSDNLENKSINSLKEKYKQQRIEKKSSNPSKSVTQNSVKKIDFKENSKEKRFASERIQTRQQLRTHSYTRREEKREVEVKSKNTSGRSSERVLRSHQTIVLRDSSPKVLKHPNNIFVRKPNTKTNKSLNSSQIGIKPKKRKARPVVPLIDYYFDSEFESDSEKKGIKSESKKIFNANDLKAKNLKNKFNDNKTKKITKSISNEKERRSPGRPKASMKSASNISNKCKTSPTSESTRRQTRSSRPLSPPKDSKALERELLIKQQIIAIEKKHKRLRRCPSDESLHSSSSSSSSSSSESLPNSLSSSSSINNTRLTRSLEHLKKIRDIAAKLKRQHNQSKTNGSNDVSKGNNRTNVKRVVNRRQSSLRVKETANAVKSITSNKTKAVKKSATNVRTLRRRRSESAVSATSDTDCDTEGPEGDDCDDIHSDMNGTEDSMASIMDEDMERASIVIQDMAEDMNTLLVNGSSETDLQYGSTEHIQGLMTCEFSGAFSDETITTASAILLPQNCHSEYTYVQTDDTQLRSTVDASTNTTDDDILASLSSDDTESSAHSESNYKTLSVGTQTKTDGPLE